MSKKSTGSTLTACFLLAAAFSFGQGATTRTAPQVVAGPVPALGLQFVTSLAFQNPGSIPCLATVVFHRGIGQALGASLRANGQTIGNQTQLTVPPRGASRLDVTTNAGGFFQGAATVTDSCGTMRISGGYLALNIGAGPQAGSPAPGSVSEVFTFDLTEGLLSEEIGGAVIGFDPQGLDGVPNSPGLAIVGDPTRQFPPGTDFCQIVTDQQDNPLTNTVCDPYDGRQMAMNLRDVFPDLVATDTAQWRFWLSQPPGSTSPARRLHPLVIDVNGFDQFRTAPTSSFNPRCPQNSLCLNDSRFAVTVEFDSGISSGMGVPQPVDNDSGLFFFPSLGTDNFEMLVNLIGGCEFNDRFWVFAAATTDVEYTLRVVDTQTGLERTYQNPLGTPAPAVTDVNAFATCP